MNRFNQYRVVAFVPVVIGYLAQAAAATPNAAVFVVLDNGAAVPAKVLQEAQADVSAIFRTAHVDVVWIESAASAAAASTSTPHMLRVQIMAAGLSGFGYDIGGVARRTDDGGTAYVFFEQVSRIADYWTIRRSVVLGEIMAHELGHLLLPAESHTLAGIMRANWGAPEFREAAQHPIGFDGSQAKLIARRLGAR